MADDKPFIDLITGKPIEPWAQAMIDRRSAMTTDDIPARARELLPCPFCGKQPIISLSGMKSDGLRIQCITDDCLGPHCSYIPPEATIVAWNTRAALSAPTVGVEEDLEAEWERAGRPFCADPEDGDHSFCSHPPPSPPSSGSGEGVEQCDPTPWECEIANAAVAENLNPDGSTKYQSAQGYACAISAIRLAALKSPTVEWQPRIGDPVQVSESCPYSGDWKRTRLWVAGLSIKRRSNGINVSVCESWPPSSDGYTDGFYIGRPNKHDDLIPGHSLTQGSGS